MGELPTGTVTMLFTDIEGSTRLLQLLGDRYADVLEVSRRLLRTAFHQYHGHEVDTQGDAFFVAFARASDALSAAVAAQQFLASQVWPEGIAVQVRMGLHTGEPQLTAEGYVGLDVHHAARIMSSGHGGQILLSQTTRDLVEHELSDAVSLRDLGVHRLKDLEHPSHLYQLVTPGFLADFPPLKTLDLHTHNLPVQFTSLIGREREVAALELLLQREDVRLLTLTGPGGIGKTRLGLQVVAELIGEYSDGVFFVNLAPIRDPAFVVPTIAQTFTIRENGAQPLFELLKAALRDKQILLLLDNFEHVVSAAISLPELLAACPRLKIVVTSRMALHVQAEQAFAVSPLTLPDPRHVPTSMALSQNEAVALFIVRVQAILPDFQVTTANAPTIAEICVRLDGLPLAIELAAARMKLFSPQALLARLGQRLQVLTGGAHDLPERQRTLRNTIAWSYHLLDESEQRLFREIAIFVGGCTLDAIEAVCAELGDALPSVLDGVESLIEKNLLQQTSQEEEEPRLRMLETIREYALVVLGEHGEMETTRAAHVAYYLLLAEEADRWLWGPQLFTWLERLEREHDNLRTALSWSLEQGSDEDAERRKDLALRFGGALHRFWFSHGHYSEGCSFLERALAASEDIATAERAKVLVVAADLLFAAASNQEDLRRGEKVAEEALVLYRAIGDEVGIAHALGQLGRFALFRNEYVRAGSLLDESVVLLEDLGNQWYLAWSLYELANAEVALGEYVKAQIHFEEAYAFWRAQGDKECSAIVLASLATFLYYLQGDLIKARSINDEALMLLRELGSKQVVEVLGLSAEIALSQGDTSSASRIAEELSTLTREMGHKFILAYALSILARVELRIGDYDRARLRYDEILTLSREIDHNFEITPYLEQLAEVVAAQGELAWAARLWGAVDALRETFDAPLRSFNRRDNERAVAATRAQLGVQAFNTAWAEGRGMTLEQVLTAPGRTEVSTILSTQQAPKTIPKQATYPDGLTTREVEVLHLVAQGLSNAEIAEQLVISLLTVKAHMRSLYNKLGISSRSAATRYAIEHHLM